MLIRKPKPYAGGSLLAATLIEALVPLLRNLALARLIAPAEFGLGLTLAIVVSLVEVLADFGLPIFAVRRPHELPPRSTLATLHSLALIRSALLGLVLLIASPWLAQVLHAEEAEAGFAYLGLIAFLRGFENFGTKAMMRTNRFDREAIVVIGSQLALLSATVLSALISPRFDCILWGMFAHTVAVLALSHALSPRAWQLGWDRSVVSEVVRFGRPLLVNGAAVVASTSDRILVSVVLGPKPLALYNVAVGSAMLPRSVLTKFLVSVLVPLFTRARGSTERFRQLADAWAFCLSAIALAYGLCIAVFGRSLLGFAFGPSYEPSGPFMAVLGLAVVVKFLLILPVPPSYAVGNTRIVAITSLVSAVSTLIASPVLIATHQPTLFLLTMTAVDTIALLWVTHQSINRLPFSPGPLWFLTLGPPVLLWGLAVVFVLNPTTNIEGIGPTLTAIVAISTASYVIIRRCYSIELRAALP